jgi:hypothetical protein
MVELASAPHVFGLKFGVLRHLWIKQQSIKEISGDVSGFAGIISSLWGSMPKHPPRTLV